MYMRNGCLRVVCASKCTQVKCQSSCTPASLPCSRQSTHTQHHIHTHTLTTRSLSQTRTMQSANLKNGILWELSSQMACGLPPGRHTELVSITAYKLAACHNGPRQVHTCIYAFVWHCLSIPPSRAHNLSRFLPLARAPSLSGSLSRIPFPRSFFT